MYKSQVLYILETLQTVQGELESLLIDISDNASETAPEGVWSPKRVVQHIIDIENSYIERLNQAL